MRVRICRWDLFKPNALTAVLIVACASLQLIVGALEAAGASGAFNRAKAVADAIVAKARACASDSSYLSPYIEEATRAGRIKSPVGAFGMTIGTKPTARA